MNHLLYGDGIHDDYPAIQEMIDSAKHELRLPEPEVCYLISRPLELPSDFKLSLPRFAEIKLAKGSNCFMLMNKAASQPDGQSIRPEELFGLVCRHSAILPCRNIEVEGGIWNFNNLEQNPNPIYTGVYEPKDYLGFGFLFCHVRNLRISSLTLKDPTNFAVTLDTVSYFTVDNITFDFNYGNPLATNMDGIHLNGNCHFGHIANLKGACYDDLVALNADEGSAGPITSITIDGLYAEDCHSAVRLLSANHPVKKVHISNVYGTYYQYCIGITRFYEAKDKGCFDSITIDSVYASKALRIPVYAKKETDYVYPLIYIQDKLRIRALRISDLHRREEINPVSTICVREDTEIDQLILTNITTENHTGCPEMPLFDNRGTVRSLKAEMLFADGEPVELKL